MDSAFLIFLAIRRFCEYYLDSSETIAVVLQ